MTTITSTSNASTPMLTNQTASTIMYDLYKDAGFTWEMASWALAINMVAFFGIPLNLSVVWVTYRTKSLHGTANFHLALGSFFEVLHQNGHLLFLYMTFSGRNFLPYWLAVRICSPAIFGLGSVALSITFTAFDRLLYVLFPTIVFSMKTGRYLAVITVLCLLCSAQNVWIFNQTADMNPDKMISGSIDEILSLNPGNYYYSYTSLGLNFVTLFFYLLLGIVLKCKPATQVESGRILKTILILITIHLSGFFAMRIFRLFISTSIYPYTLRWHISQSMSLLLNMSTASTGPILYLTSKEYMNAFAKEFRLIFGRFSSRVGPRKTQQTIVSSCLVPQRQQQPIVVVNNGMTRIVPARSYNQSSK